MLMISEKMPRATIVSAARVRFKRGRAVASLMAKNPITVIAIVNAPKSDPCPKTPEARNIPVKKMPIAATDAQINQTRVALSSFTFRSFKQEVAEVRRRARSDVIIFHVGPYAVASSKLGEHSHDRHVDHFAAAVELSGLTAGQRRQRRKVSDRPGISFRQRRCEWAYWSAQIVAHSLRPEVHRARVSLAPWSGCLEVHHLPPSPHQMRPQR